MSLEGNVGIVALNNLLIGKGKARK